jgi:hypothetical protein
MPSLSTQGQNTGYTHYLEFTYEDLQRQSWADSVVSATDIRKKVAFANKGDVVSYILFYTETAASGAADMTMTAGVTETGITLMSSFDMDNSSVSVNTGTGLSNNRAGFSIDSPIWIRIQGSIADLISGEWVVALKILSVLPITK